MNASIAANHTITIFARGQQLDTATFIEKAEADAYKRSARSWAVANKVQTHVVTQRWPLAEQPVDAASSCLAFAS